MILLQSRTSTAKAILKTFQYLLRTKHLLQPFIPTFKSYIPVAQLLLNDRNRIQSDADGIKQFTFPN